MRIFIDIGHPAHVHYFRNFIKIMEARGHTFFVSARNRSIIHYLLNKYNIPFWNRGKGRNNILGKMFYMLEADIKLFQKSVQFRPDIFISFASPYAAQVAWIIRKPHIVLDDTEHTRFAPFFYKPFSKVILNPSCFQKPMGPKQFRFNSFAELFYLHKNYYRPNSDIFKNLGLFNNEKFVLLRFVSWKALHDIGHNGLDLETKKKLINFLEHKGYKVFISDESEDTEPFFQEYILKISPEQIHDVLAYSTIFISEGATMASESAMLGTPAIYVNSLDAGTLREQEDKFSLINGFRSSKGVLKKVEEMLNTPHLYEIYQIRRQAMLCEKIDPTVFLVWFIENYPSSLKILKENPDYQLRFKLEI